MRPYTPFPLTCHVDKTGIMALECHRHGGSRTIPVLGHDQVRLARTRRLLLVLVLAVQKNNDVTILFDTIMDIDSISDEVMHFEDCRIVNWLIPYTLYKCDSVPENVLCS